MDIYISHYYCNTNIYLRCVYLNYVYYESKLRPCGQLSKYVGPLDALPTQTAKERGQLPVRVRGPMQMV
jgi:hypothetical protein